jgi:Putative zincin peptidase
MFFVPGFLISLLTFPGVIVHEFAHKLFCDWSGTKVLKVCYFRLGNPAGYVLHERPRSAWTHLLIGFGPLFVNTVVGFLIGLVVIALKGGGGAQNPYVGPAVLWLGVSVAMHSFPSTGDAKSISSALWRRDTPVLAKVVGIPLVGLIYLGAIGSIFWLNALYGIGVVIGLPIALHLN